MFRYFNKDTVGLDFEGMKADIKAAPEGSIVLLHACAHVLSSLTHSSAHADQVSEPNRNRPYRGTVEGAERNRQGEEALSILRHGRSSPALLMQGSSSFTQAYQGFASGDILKDAFAVRYFVDQGHQILLCQSFAKVGQSRAECPVDMLTILVRTSVSMVNELVPSRSSAPTPRRRLESTLSSRLSSDPCTRTLPSSNRLSYVKISCADVFCSGARLVTAILGSEQLYDEWSVSMTRKLSIG